MPLHRGRLHLRHGRRLRRAARRLGVDRRLLAERDDADLHQAEQVGVVLVPLVQVGKVDAAGVVDMAGDLVKGQE